jgi:hypothetical protein
MLTDPSVASPISPSDSRDPRRFAVLTIPIEAPDWKPRSERSTPPAELSGAPIELQADFVAAFNASDFAASRKRLAVLLCEGGIRFLSNVAEADRPQDAGGLPAAASNGMTRHEAAEKASLMNAETYRVARVPRQWTIAIRHPAAELAAVEGGRS